MQTDKVLVASVVSGKYYPKLSSMRRLKSKISPNWKLDFIVLCWVKSQIDLEQDKKLLKIQS